MNQTRTAQAGVGAIPAPPDRPDEFLTALRPFVESQRNSSGSVLFLEGEPGECAYVVSEGSVQIIKQEEGRPVLIAERGPGEMIGEMALIDDSPRFASAICVTDCELFLVHRDRFFELLGARSNIAERMLRMMTARVREADVKRLQELEATNQVLRDAQARLEAAVVHRDRILSLSPYPIIVTDAEGRISLLNPAAEELLGQAIGVSLWTCLVPRDGTIPAQAAHSFEHEGGWRAEIEANSPFARGLFCRIVAVRIADTETGHGTRLWIIEDVTGMRTLQKQAVEQYGLAMKGEMAGEIAHELNNYLTILSGNAELLPLRLKSKDPTAVERTLETIRQAIAQMTIFTDNLLRSRHPMGQRTRINLNEFLANLVAFLRPQKRFKKLIIKTELGGSLPELECDPSGLQQVVYNLLLNAADALTEAHTSEPTVFVSTHCDAGRGSVYMTVADNGPGIPSEVAPQLFRERVSSKPTGHGFGTMTILRLVQEHGGSISASERPGGGAQFVITLPVSPAPATKA